MKSAHLHRWDLKNIAPTWVRDFLEITWTTLRRGFLASWRRKAQDNSQSYFEGFATTNWPKRPSKVVHVISRKSLYHAYAIFFRSAPRIWALLKNSPPSREFLCQAAKGKHGNSRRTILSLGTFGILFSGFLCFANNKAPGAPGKLGTWSEPAKDAYGTTLKRSVWFTLTHGALSEIAYPTVELV